MTPDIDITAKQRQMILSLLERHLPGTAAWAYGSRVKQKSQPTSDLDLVVFATPEQDRRVGDLREAFEESDLPFRVDLFVWNEVPESFRKHIKVEHVILMEKQQWDVGSDWPTASLGEVTELTLSSVDKKSKPHEHAVLLCNYMDVYSNRFIRSDLDFMTVTATEHEIRKCTLQPGDVIITKDSEQYNDIGVPALMRDDMNNLVCGYHLAILHPLQESIRGSYLFYALQIENTQHQFHAYANGVTRFGLRKDDILRVKIPLPPLPEQRVIAYVLGALDEKIELNRRMSETLEAMGHALFKSWFVDFDPIRAKAEGCDTDLPNDIVDLFPDKFIDSEVGEIPEGWKAIPLSGLIEVNPPRPLRRGTLAPYLDMANMPTKGHTPERVIDRPFSSGMRFTNGDTLVARITPCLENGKAAYVDFLEQGQIGWGSTEYIVLHPKFPLPCEFAYYLVRSSRFREFAIRNLTGTSGRQRVPAKALTQFILPSPPDKVSVAFGQLTRPLIARATKAITEAHTLSALRDTLLPRLVSGELRLAPIADRPKSAA